MKQTAANTDAVMMSSKTIPMFVWVSGLFKARFSFSRSCVCKSAVRFLPGCVQSGESVVSGSGRSLQTASLTADSAAATSPACSRRIDWSSRSSASDTHRSQVSDLPAEQKRKTHTALNFVFSRSPSRLPRGLSTELPTPRCVSPSARDTS